MLKYGMQPHDPIRLPMELIDWTSLVPLIAKANGMIYRFDGQLQSIPNPSVLLSPLETQEAVLSSKIEGTQATLVDVLKYDANPNGPRTSKTDDILEIGNYRRAMWYAISELEKKPLCLNLIRNIHSILLDGVRGEDKARGNFRTIQNWIGPDGCTIEQARYVPPVPDLVPGLLDNWEKYMHYDEKDKIVQLAIIHAQFEIIHPFLDGNGRIGRILLPLFLFDKKILSTPMFYLSSYFEAHRSDYYKKLNLITEKNEWNEWLVYFLNAIISQAEDNCKKTKAIHDLYEEMKSKVTEITKSRFAIKTLDAIFSKPIFGSSVFIDSSGIPRESAMKILKKLSESGIIKVLEVGSGRSPNMYIFTDLLRIVR